MEREKPSPNPPRKRNGTQKPNANKKGKGASERIQPRSEPVESPWMSLPPVLLAKCFSFLQTPHDLASAGLTCRAWAEEIEDSVAWERIWRGQYSQAPLWRWACAAGGYRKQLQASAVMQKGDCSIRTLPFSRQDGAVLEVLLLDGEPQRIVTVQHRALHPQAMRLSGLTLKVWDDTTLKRGSPLLVVHDVLKHFQTDGGQLVCWKVVDSEIIRIGSQVAEGGSGGAGSSATAFNWASDERIRCYKVNPVAASITELPIQSTFGRGAMPHEWMDMPGGGLASVSYHRQPARSGELGHITCSIFDCGTGRRILSAKATLAEDSPVPPQPLGDMDPCMLVSRSAGPESSKKIVLVAACLFDHRVFRWEIPIDYRTTNRDVIQGGREAAEEELEPLFTCPMSEQVYDLAMASPSARIYVVAQENFYVFNGDGQPLCVINMSDWPGVSRRNPLLMQDVGAFSWPLPNTHRIAFHLDATNAIYLVDLAARPPTPFPGPLVVNPTWQSEIATCCTANALEIGAVYVGLEMAFPPPAPTAPAEWGATSRREYKVASHLQVKPKPITKSLTRVPMEPTVVEYTQCGRVLVTVADTGLSGTQRAATSKPQRKDVAWDWGRQGTSVDPRRSHPHYQRCLALINTESGEIFRTVPLRNSIVEAVHSSGSTLAVAVARKDPDDSATEGAILLLNFGPQASKR